MMSSDEHKYVTVEDAIEMAKLEGSPLTEEAIRAFLISIAKALPVRE